MTRFRLFLLFALLLMPGRVIAQTQDIHALRIVTQAFERAKQESDRDEGVFGWLNISHSYKSAWIIDGQHRLFAYSGHELSKKGVFSVLAFEGIPSGVQAQLFVDINAKQKSISRYENGISIPSIETLVKIAKVFKKPVSYFLDE